MVLTRNAGAKGAFRPGLPGLTLKQGGGPWLATRAALKAYLAANDGSNNPHANSALAVNPTLTMSTGTTSAPGAPYTGLTSVYSYPGSAAFYRADHGGDYSFSGTRRFPVTTRLSGGNVDGLTLNAIGWRIGFRHTGRYVSFRIDGGNATQFTLWNWIVDKKYMVATEPATTGAGRRWLTFDFGSAATREIIMEGTLAAGFLAFAVTPGDTVEALPQSGFNGIIFGDSFTEGTGAAIAGSPSSWAANGYSFVLADYLAINDIWASGYGSTGYVQAGSGVKLSSRLATDLDRANAIAKRNIIGLAMGYNDIGQSSGSIQSEAAACIAIARARNPAALIFVIGPWDLNAPSAPVANYSATKSAIQAAAASAGGGVYFLDMEGVSYTKSGDAVHPNTAGHQTLGTALNTKIRTLLAA